PLFRSWDRLSPRAHLWTGVPIPFVSVLGAISILAVNSWLNTPQGFTLSSKGLPKNVDVAKAMFTPAFPWEVTHFVIAAYLGAGFVAASVYAVGMLRGRNDRYHRLGFLIPFTVAAILTPVQLVVGDQLSRLVRVRVVAETTPPENALVPALCRGLGRRHSRDHRGGVVRHRSRASALGRLQRAAHQGCGHGPRRHLGHVRGHRRLVRTGRR